jgi:hypothetical protein
MPARERAYHLLEAVEIEDANFKWELAAKFPAQSSAAQQGPRGLFRCGGAAAQFANSLSGDAHEQSITALPGIDGAIEVGCQGEVNLSE